MTNDFSQKLTTVLGGVSVDIRVWYQDIGEGWFISMEFTAGAGIVSGHRINTASPITISYLTDFIGEVICLPTTENNTEPGKDAPWGNTHRLVYMTEEEAIEAGLADI
ncbi:MAG: hypothetical protein KAR40_13895 [Candidatus Sabulitectum sp.]|nr:hypothetical protein [Candidatus Sabulitectum sp.]